MLALGFTIALFAFWSLVGYAVIRAIGARMDPVQEMLLSPVVGVVVLTIGLYLVGRMGVPVGRFAYPLTVALIVAAGAPLLLARPRLPWRDWRPFGAILLLALLTSGWPMFEFSFNWLSLCNDDMANYCLGAGRFYHYGYLASPTPQELIEGRDYSQFYWFLHVAGMVRPGVELLMAWSMALTQHTPQQVFMPLSLAFHLCQVSALGALIHQSPAMRRPALAACAMLAVSALATFGVIYQLIAQVFGMALVAGAAAVLLRPFNGLDVRTMVRRGLIAGVFGVGLFLLYPEVIPIVGAAWMVYLLVEALGRRVPPRAVGAFLAGSLLVLLLVVGRQVVGFAGFLFNQANTGAAGVEGRELQEAFFPFYQLPSGFADFWGFFPLMYIPPEPFGSIGIAAGALLLLGAVAAAVWRARLGDPVAIVCSVMLALAAFLVLRRAHFGVYKIAMFLQPFVLGCVALAVFALVKRPRVAVAVLAVLALPGFCTQVVYVLDSRGTGTAGGFPEIADPSRSRINDQFKQVLSANADSVQGAGVVIDTSNVVLAKFQAYFTRGYETVFPGTGTGTALASFDRRRSMAPDATLDIADQLQQGLNPRIRWYEFDLHDPAETGLKNKFRYPELGPFAEPPPPAGAPQPLLVIEGPKQSILNRWGPRRRMGQSADEVNFFSRRLDHVRDHLIFIDSKLGRSYYNARYDVSKYQLEPDPVFFHEETMTGMGRRVMFQVFRPTPGLRLVMELTASLNADGQNLLPSGAAVIGTARHSFGISGRGSARVFSPPVEPQAVGEWEFVAIDMGRDAGPLIRPRKGLMRLYGRHVSLDRRLLVCYGRNLSAVSPRDYAGMRPPSRLESFPRDLQNPEVEYSGFYEDGWLSDHAWCRVSEPWNATSVVVKGYVPEMGDPAFQTELRLLVDGHEVKRQWLGLKGFEVRAPLPPAQAAASASARSAELRRPKIELQFSRLQSLPQPDGRPVACNVVSVGIEGAVAPPVLVQKFPQEFHANPMLSPDGLYPDGWAAPRTSVRLSQPPGYGYLAVRGEVPRIADDSFTTDLRIRVDGAVVAEQALRPGPFEIAVPVPLSSSGPGARQVELEFTRAQQLPAGDGRAVGALLKSIGFTPEPLPPTTLARFPDDLKKPLVQATGVYDDGWIGQTASLQVTQPPDSATLFVSGMVPKIADAATFATDLTVLVDGTEVGRKTLGLDRFSVTFAVPPPASAVGVARRVELRFSAVQALPPPDGRSVGARLESLGFDPESR